MSGLEIVDNISIGSGGLIRSRHTTIDDQKLTILDEISDAVLFLFGLLVPPHFEELHLGVGESSLWVFLEFLDHGSEHTINGSQIEI